jgi:hypothetical protein
MRLTGAWLASCCILVACGDVKEAEHDAGAIPDAAADAAIDAAPVTARFDVGYVDSITITPSTTEVSSVIAVVNTSNGPLDLSTARVIAFVDDNSNARMTFDKAAGSTLKLAPGRAAGRLSPLAKSKVLVDGLIEEPLDDQMLNFSITFETTPIVGQIVSAQAIIGVGTATIVLPFVLTTDDGVDIQLTHANRLPSK